MWSWVLGYWFLRGRIFQPIDGFDWLYCQVILNLPRYSDNTRSMNLRPRQLFRRGNCPPSIALERLPVLSHHCLSLVTCFVKPFNLCWYRDAKRVTKPYQLNQVSIHGCIYWFNRVDSRVIIGTVYGLYSVAYALYSFLLIALSHCQKIQQLPSWVMTCGQPGNVFVTDWVKTLYATHFPSSTIMRAALTAKLMLASWLESICERACVCVLYRKLNVEEL